MILDFIVSLITHPLHLAPSDTCLGTRSPHPSQVYPPRPRFAQARGHWRRRIYKRQVNNNITPNTGIIKEFGSISKTA